MEAFLTSFDVAFAQPTWEVQACFLNARTFQGVASCATHSSYSATFSIMAVMCLFTFAASFVTNNDSWVDRLWSIVPVVYAWIFHLYKVPVSATSQLSSSLVFTVLVTLWGARLTYNFYRKGGYRKGGEDYRWAYVRQWEIFARVPLLWSVFSLVVVSSFQSWLLWIITIPLQSLSSSHFDFKSQLAAGTFVLFLALETLADQQQWNFQCEKHHQRPRREGVMYDFGFCIQGTFAFSRHLNVWSEQSIWTTVFLAAAFHEGSLLHASCIGCVVLIALTVGSTTLTEKISSSKYEFYKYYQMTTPMLLPTIRSTEELTKHFIKVKRN